MRIITLFICLSALFTQLSAREKGQFKSALWNDSTSDDIDATQLTVDYRNHRRNIFWTFDQVEDRALDWGVKGRFTTGDYKGADFHGTSLMGVVGFKLSPSHYSQGQLGINSLTNQNKVSSTILPWSLKHDFLFKPFHITGSINHDYLYHELSLPGAINHFINFTQYQLKVQYSPYKHIRIPVTAKYKIYSDSNKRFDTNVSILYGSSSPIWIWGGIDIGYINNDRDVDGYWTARNLVSVGPMFDIGYSFLKMWSLSGSASLSRVRENKYWGWVRSIAVNLKFGNRNTWEAGAGFSRIESIQNGSDWNNTQLRIFGTYSL